MSQEKNDSKFQLENKYHTITLVVVKWHIHNLTAILLNAAICLNVCLIVKGVTGFRRVLLWISQGMLYKCRFSIPEQSLENGFLIIYQIQCNSLDKHCVEDHYDFDVCRGEVSAAFSSSSLSLCWSLFGKLISKYLGLF